MLLASLERLIGQLAAIYQLVHSTLPVWSLKTKELLANFRQVFENKGVVGWGSGGSFDFAICQLSN